MRVSDIAAIAEIAHRNGAIVVVDNTTTPLPQSPLDLGRDISVQSFRATSTGRPADLLGGVAATNDDALAEPPGTCRDHWRNAFAHRLYRLLQRSNPRCA